MQINDEISVREVKIILAQAHSAKTKLTVLRRNKANGFPAKIKLHKLLVLPCLLQGSESWMLTADLERRKQAFQNKCYSRMLGVS